MKKDSLLKAPRTEQHKVEHTGINLQNERSLHLGLKQWFAQPQDRLEVPVDGFVIDLVRGEQLVEFQTRNFSAIRPKLKALLPFHKIHLLHPITYEKWVVQVDPVHSQVVSRRKSVVKGAMSDMFEELVRLPELVSHPNLTLEFVLIREEEVRCRDGKGSKYRKRASIRDRKLVEVISSHLFSCAKDFLQFIPENLLQPFSNKDLQKANPIKDMQIELSRKPTVSGILVSNLDTNQPDKGKPIKELMGMARSMVPNSASLRSKAALMVGILDVQLAKLNPDRKKNTLNATRCELKDGMAKD